LLDIFSDPFGFEGLVWTLGKVWVVDSCIKYRKSQMRPLNKIQNI
jgi:hypothetical protein